jgi:GT2 family glycosyltransferase
MKTTIAIVNWNSGKLLQACVESALDGSDCEILVFDNNSEDGSTGFLNLLPRRVQLVRSERNRGFAGGVNELFRRCDTPYVFILNPDIRVQPGSVQLLERFMDAQPRAAVVGAYVGEKYLPRYLPTVGSLVMENLGLPRKPVVKQNDFVEVEQIAAAAMMIRRDVYKASMFDEGFYPAWYEDVDFCRRLKRDEWRVFFAPHIKFAHAGGYSAETLGTGRFVYYYYRNQARYARKWFGMTGSLAVRASITLGAAGRMLGRPRSALAYGKVLFGALGGW